MDLRVATWFVLWAIRALTFVATWTLCSSKVCVCVCVCVFLFGNVLQVLMFYQRASQVALLVKKPPAVAGDIRNVRWIPGWGRSPGGGHGNPHSILTWEISWTEESGGLQSIGSQRVIHDWRDLAQCYKFPLNYSFSSISNIVMYFHFYSIYLDIC